MAKKKGVQLKNIKDAEMPTELKAKKGFAQNKMSSFLKNVLYLSLLIPIAVIFAFGLRHNLSGTVISSHSTLSPEKKNEIPVAVATQAATIAPTPTPTPIATVPIHSGKHVRVPILTYHYIGNNPNPADKARDNLEVVPDLFDKQMNYLASNGFNTITFDTLYAAIKSGGGLPAKPVLLTFDDGYVDFYLNAFPILKKYNLKATAFIITGMRTPGYYMSWDQIKELSNSSLISIEAHTVNHPNMTSLTYEQMLYQASESKKVLEAETGKSVDFFAYPYGISNEFAWKAVKQAGYKAAVGTWFGTIESEGVLFDLPRVKIAGGLSLEDFEKKVQ